jgi:hypothetical protein
MVLEDWSLLARELMSKTGKGNQLRLERLLLDKMMLLL